MGSVLRIDLWLSVDVVARVQTDELKLDIRLAFAQSPLTSLLPEEKCVKRPNYGCSRTLSLTPLFKTTVRSSRVLDDEAKITQPPMYSGGLQSVFSDDGLFGWR